MMLTCNDNKVLNYDMVCFEGLHIIYTLLSVIFSLIFYILIICLNIFYFYPFNSKSTSTKVDTTADTFLYIFKIIAVIRLVAMNSDWISIVIMIVASILNCKRAYENPTYNNNLLETVINTNLDNQY
jgi:hypothetical protein